uniref:Uncharacterized protein n=1 Tax=Xiphophorus couchianus TaxID=32473 RepID=A0A3B5MF46_9TELE
MPKVLIVGDEAVNGISHVCNPKKTRVISFPGDTVSDLTLKVLSLTTDQSDIESLVVHVGANDVAKQKSEILKKDFNILLNTMGKLKMKNVRLCRIAQLNRIRLQTLFDEEDMETKVKTDFLLNETNKKKDFKQAWNKAKKAHSN